MQISDICLQETSADVETGMRMKCASPVVGRRQAATCNTESAVSKVTVSPRCPATYAESSVDDFVSPATSNRRAAPPPPPPRMSSRSPLMSPQGTLPGPSHKYRPLPELPASGSSASPNHRNSLSTVKTPLRSSPVAVTGAHLVLPRKDSIKSVCSPSCSPIPSPCLPCSPSHSPSPVRSRLSVHLAPDNQIQAKADQTSISSSSSESINSQEGIINPCQNQQQHSQQQPSNSSSKPICTLMQRNGTFSSSIFR